MDRGPDGSLCRITSSAKHLISNVRIIKVPEGKPTYRLEIINPIEEEKIPSSESDEEISDDEFPIKTIEIEADKLLDIEKIVGKPNEKINEKPKEKINEKPNEKPNEKINEKPMGRHIHHKWQNKSHKGSNYHGRKNTFNNSQKEYKGINKNRGYEYGNKDFNSSTSRDFNSNVNPNLAYKNDNFKHSTMRPNPQPWVTPPVVMHPNYTYPQFSAQHQLPKNLRNSLGLFGVCPPYAPSCDQNSLYPMASNFQPNTNNAFICDQTPMHSPMPSSSHNSFVHNQNSSFSQRSSNYLHNQTADKSTRGKRYRNSGYNKFGNKHPKDNNKRKQDYYNKNSRRHQNVRNNPSYDYRN